jgi:uncharacterized protein (TIGR03382 family)
MRHFPVLFSILGFAFLNASIASAAFYTTTNPTPWYGWSFDPLSGAVTQGFDTTNYPLAFSANSQGVSVSLKSSLNPGVNFALAGASTDTFTIFPQGTTIDASTAFSAGTGDSYLSESTLSFDGSTVYYLGFRYTNQGLGTNETYYGWANFTAHPGSFFGDELNLLAFGVGDNGQGVVTGIPEPSAALLGGLGLLALFRRRRN